MLRRWHESGDVTSPHRLVAQDGALSRPKQRFESAWGHKITAVKGGFLFIQSDR